MLRALPEWFGIESALVQYVQDTATMETWMAESGGHAVGFVTLHMHNPHAAEIHCIAVVSGSHRRGVGRLMVRWVEQECRARRAKFLQVKTLGPSRPDVNYERTRRFYEALGFLPLEEYRTLWPGNPCLLYIKAL